MIFNSVQKLKFRWVAEMRLFCFILFYSILLLLPGCQSAELKLSSIGKESEVLVVCQDSLYDTDAVKVILAALTEDYPALPQQEPLFDVTRINESSFSELFRRNKAILKIETTTDETKLYVKRNPYANQQVVLLVKINEKQLHDSIAGHQLGLTTADFFTKEERRSRIEKLNRAYSEKISEAVSRNFGFRISVPEDFFIAKEDRNFIWLRRETSNTSSSILIYSLPAMVELNMVAIRDSVTKIHIPGPSDGSYMIVNRDIETVISTDSLLNHSATITRGIWKVENDFMGGPFVNFCIPDPDRSRIICIDVFVYAPKFEKREYINRLLAIAYSAEAEQ